MHLPIFPETDGKQHSDLCHRHGESNKSPLLIGMLREMLSDNPIQLLDFGDTEGLNMTLLYLIENPEKCSIYSSKCI